MVATLARTAAVVAAAVAIMASTSSSPVAAMPVGDELVTRAASTSNTSTTLDPTLKSCLGNTGATLTYPGDQRYANLSAAENTNYHLMPNVLAQPTSTQQVAAIVQCVAAQNGSTKISPRSGGHGYAAYSLDANVVLDSSKMKSITYDTAAKTVTAGFGQTLGPLAASMADQGFALPHGTCPQVGIGGHSLGGGWGYSSRKWGWLVDHIVNLELVDATGAVHNISQNSTGANADLWWALRGAGSNNFGVVTHFTFAMEPAPTSTVNYKHVYGTNADCAQVLLAVAKLGSVNGTTTPYLPSELGGEVLMYGENSGDDGACSFSGQFLGTKDDYKSAMKMLNDELASSNVTATSVSAKEFGSWKAALTDLMGDLFAPKVYEQYYAQSIVDDGTPGYTLDSATQIVQAVQAAVGVEGTGNSISFDLNGPNSATNLLPAPNGDMEFIHRKALFFSQIYSYGFPNYTQQQAQETALNAISNITNTVRKAKPAGDWHAYQNYIDPNITNFGEAYYGTTLTRLEAIKKTADPNTIFDFTQGLANAVTST